MINIKTEAHKCFAAIINRYLKYALIALLMAYTGISFAQDEYRTSAGTLIIKVEQDGNPIKVRSKKLLILLDYETGKLVMKQKVSDLTSDNDGIQYWLNNNGDSEITFEGKLGIDYINTKGHPPLNFPVEGLLSPGESRIMGNGHLVHRVEKSSASCLLSMTFQLKLDDVFPGLKLQNVNNDIYVQVVQSLLARVNER